MLAHARTLTFVTGRIPAGRRTFLLLAIRLDDIDFAELLETLGYKRIEPGLRDFPVAALFIPVWIGSTSPADPGSVRQIIW
jgi:hypothetical protein